MSEPEIGHPWRPISGWGSLSSEVPFLVVESNDSALNLSAGSGGYLETLISQDCCHTCPVVDPGEEIIWSQKGGR